MILSTILPLVWKVTATFNEELKHKISDWEDMCTENVLQFR